jgi:glycosyltransferase involved in cell wall biosynthesis
MSHDPTIDILLATYNGERFLSEQLQSLLNQTYSHWRLIIRDDGSTDDTLSIIHRYQQQYPQKIIIIKDGHINLGACRNFARLLEHASAEYVMFSDQDDVWLSTKIAWTLEKMKAMAEIHGNDVPLLVYTDMKVVDDRLSIISESFWENQAFNPAIGRSLNRFLVSNVATGCTVMINKRLRDLSVPIPQDALMHDWWAGLIAVALGQTDCVDEATMLYRQHSMNVVGAKWDISIKTIVQKLIDFKKLKQINRTHLLKTQKQAMALGLRFEALLPKEKYEKIMVYANLDSQSFIMKRVKIIQYGFWWAGFTRSFTMFLII